MNPDPHLHLLSTPIPTPASIHTYPILIYTCTHIHTYTLIYTYTPSSSTPASSSTPVPSCRLVYTSIYTCTHIHTYTLIYICTHIHLYLHLHLHIHLHTHLSTPAPSSTPAPTPAHTSIYTCMYTLIYTCTQPCTPAMYTWMHAHISICNNASLVRHSHASTQPGSPLWVPPYRVASFLLIPRLPLVRLHAGLPTGFHPHSSAVLAATPFLCSSSNALIYCPMPSPLLGCTGALPSRKSIPN